MKKERWRLYAKKADFAAISKAYGINQVTARIMRNRGVETKEEIESYLKGDLDYLSDPALMKDADKAASLLEAAIANNELIAISSDFDNDGIFSGLLLKEAIIELGGRAAIFTPNRVMEGYGVNSRIVEEANARGASVLLTCDNGIAAFEAIDEAKKLGMTVIVTDHHEVPFEEHDGKKIYILPKADAIVDPKQEDCAYPFKSLCGTGVAYQLMTLLFRRMKRTMSHQEIFLQYTAIATVADVMELVGENRILVRKGLSYLNHTNHTGLRALMEVCGIAPEQVRAYHIGFILGPCFNAAGRLDTIVHALALLESKEYDQALALAGELWAMNEERKELTRVGTERAVELIEHATWKDEHVYLVYIKDCHESVAGIIAGRLRERYYRPVLVFTDASEEGQIKASGRSIDDYDMFTELSAFRNLFLRFGGHKMAAGLTMEKKNLEILRDGLNARCTLTQTQLMPLVMIDAAMPLGYISEEVIADLEKLEPFGRANEKPLFAQQHLSVLRLSRIGKNRNVVKMSVMGPEGIIMDALYFGDTDVFFDFLEEEYGRDNVAAALRGMRNTIDIGVTYYPQINEFQGKRSLQIVIQNYCRVSLN
ncbi:single-stranded-DNA-specific exonuclease RecJ [Anthropogastromicrobium sp.]|uniref:single-stranded-DNA-specific exonuclease RecJ n=1 Tax=Anthropogastromicrobium sp. TaxID=2981649 RepID=UPI00307B154A